MPKNHESGQISPPIFVWHAGKSAASIDFGHEAMMVLEEDTLSPIDRERLEVFLEKIQHGEISLDERLTVEEFLKGKFHD